MSEEIATAAGNLAEIARLRTDLAGRDAHIAQQDEALKAERDARSRYELIVHAARAVAHNPAPANITRLAAAIDHHDRAPATESPGASLLAELDAARAVVAAARTGFGTEEDIRRAWAFDPNLLTARIRAYDEATKVRNE